jgi:hypothetical protein
LALVNETASNIFKPLIQLMFALQRPVKDGASCRLDRVLARGVYNGLSSENKTASSIFKALILRPFSLRSREKTEKEEGEEKA